MSTFLTVINLLAGLVAVLGKGIEYLAQLKAQQLGRQEVESELNAKRAQDATTDAEIMAERRSRDDLGKRLQDGTF